MVKINWRYIQNIITTKDIHEIESFFNITLPKDYIDCVLLNNGGKPTPCVFKIANEDGYVFNNLLNVKEIIKVHENVSEYLGKIIPFANDPAGNLICFDYRESKDISPKIVFWDHEKASDNSNEAIKYICDNFKDLLNMLHIFEEE